MSSTYLYHYTSSEGLEGTLSAGVIWSFNFTGPGATMGKGVYLTSLGPSTNVQYLVENNWGGGSQLYSPKRSHLDYFIRFQQEDLPHARRLNSDRNVWLIPHDIFLKHVPHFIGTTISTYLYHYTSREGIESIQSAGVIRSSRASNDDAFLGDGVYLTSLDPSNHTEDLLKNNWDSIPQFCQSKGSNLKYFVRFLKEDLPDAKPYAGLRNIWVVYHDIVLVKDKYIIGKRQESKSWCIIS